MPNPDTSLRTRAIPEYSSEENAIRDVYERSMRLIMCERDDLARHSITDDQLNEWKRTGRSDIMTAFQEVVAKVAPDDQAKLSQLEVLREKYLNRINKFVDSITVDRVLKMEQLKELSEELSRHIVKPVSLSLYNARLMKKNVGSALKLFKDFPNLYLFSLQEAYVSSQESLARAYSEPDEIVLFCSSKSSVTDSAMLKKDYSIASVHHMLTHELGHVINNQLIDLVSCAVSGTHKRKDYFLRQNESFKTDHDLVSKALFQELSENLKQEGLLHYDISTTKGRARACEEGIISKYASTNNGEMFAEFICQYYQILYRNECRIKKGLEPIEMPIVTKMFVEKVNKLFNNSNELAKFINRHKKTLGEPLLPYQRAESISALTNVRRRDARTLLLADSKKVMHSEEQTDSEIVSKLKSEPKASFEYLISDTSNGCAPSSYSDILLLKIPQLSDSKVVHLFNKLTDEQIEYLTYHKTHKISNSVLELLPERAIQKFSKKAIVRLHYSSWRKSEVDYVIHKLSPAQIALLGYEQIHSVSNSNLALLTNQQVQMINSEYVIPRLSKGELKSLLKNFSETQIKALTYEQIHKFTRWELRDLKPNFVEHLSQEVVRRLNQTEYSALVGNLTDQQKSWWEHRSEAILQTEVATAAPIADAPVEVAVATVTAASAAPASEVAAGEVAASEITAESAGGGEMVDDAVEDQSRTPVSESPQTETASEAEGQNGVSLSFIVSATLAGGADGADRDPLAPSESADEGAKKGTSDGASPALSAHVVSVTPNDDQLTGQPVAQLAG